MNIIEFHFLSGNKIQVQILQSKRENFQDIFLKKAKIQQMY